MNVSAPTTPSIPPPEVNTTQNASDISQNASGQTQGFNFPSSNPANGTEASTALATNANATNAGVANPIDPNAQLAKIAGQAGQMNSADVKNQSLQQLVASLTQPSLATQQAQQETQAGVFGPLQDSVTQFSNQLQGLTDQSNALQLAAGAGGTIENNKLLNTNTMQGGVFGATALSEQQLRENQVQQATIVAQALTVKSMLYAAQNKLSNAKAAADAAAQVAFGTQQAKIDQVNALIAANKDQMTKADQAQALTVQAELTRAQDQLNFQQDNVKTGMAAIADALKNNPNDPNAQYAAQQASQIPLTDPNYLQKVTNLVGQYGTDVTMRNLDLALKSAQTRVAQANAGLLENPGASVPGITGSSTIDTTQQGYYTDPVQGAGGLTQAAIDQAALQFATTGKMPSIGLGSSGLGGQHKTAIENRAGEIGNGTNIATNAAQLKSLNSSLTQQSNYYNTVQRSFNTANENLATITQFMQTAKVNTASNVPIINSLNNAVKAQLTDPGTIAGFKAALTGLRQEYSQVLARGGQRSDATDAQAASLIPDNLTPTQLQQVAARLNAEGTNAINSAQKQVQSIQTQMNSILSPQSTSQTQPTLIPANQIPSGYYQASDGLLYKK